VPTTTVKTIGTSSRDYSTLQAWEDAAAANLVTADEIWQGQCYNDSEFTAALTVSGSTVDATRYKELTTATGQSFADNANKLTNALRYNQSNGVGLNVTAGYTTAIDVSENYFRMSKMQVTRNTGGGASRAWLDSGVTGARASQCIFESDRSASVARGETDAIFSSCLFVSRVSSVSAILTVASTGGTVINCTLVVPSDLTAATDGVTRSYASGWTVKNCAIFGVTNTGDTTGITYTTCYSDDASPPTGVTTATYNTTTGSGFENITDSTRDFRIKSTSSLIDVGTTDTAGSPDIVGTTRSGTYDVGCWEYAAAGGGSTELPSLTMPPMMGAWGRR
jgi:hypothetical protein